MMNEQNIYLSEKQIQKRIQELGETITQDMKGKDLVCIGILKGSIIFMADLIRHIQLPLSIDFMAASSYGDAMKSSGVVKINMDLAHPIEGKDVLIIEDIVDTGLTLDYLLKHLKMRKPKSLTLCSLLLKPSKLKKPIQVDYLGFSIDDRFVIGYGLDHAEKFRNLPYLAYVEEEDSENQKEKK